MRRIEKGFLLAVILFTALLVIEYTHKYENLHHPLHVAVSAVGLVLSVVLFFFCCSTRK